MAYWLIKSNPNCFNIDDLKQMDTEIWDGVRNYRARNFMRDEMKVGDSILFYHSSANPSGVAGIMTVSREGYPDPTQFHPEHRHFDPKATEDNPRWFMIDVQFKEKFRQIVPLNELKTLPELEDSLLLRKGCEQLTVMPLSITHWNAIMNLAEDLGALEN